jgi:RimK family alpha-L-glutamate ligase
VILALLANPTRTNLQLAYAWRGLGVDARVLWPWEALDVLRQGDVALLRLDVVPTLDGVEPGLQHAHTLEERGVRVLNRPDALLATHDKLLTAQVFGVAGIPHPWTAHVEPGGPIPDCPFPCVLKPRFGSWGQDVYLCRTNVELSRMLEVVAQRPWWRRHGGLLQELVPSSSDTRVLFAGKRVVGGAERIAAPGEWRTNVTLGGRVVKGGVPPGTGELALRAARAIGVDFAGVDLLPGEKGWVVLELNGAVDFDTRYAFPGVDPYRAILDGLGVAVPGMREAARTVRLVSTDEREVAMAKTVHGKPARPGDEIVITGHSVGDSPKTGVIEEVLGEAGRERFRVRWEDGHESIFFPGDDALVRRPRRRRASTAAT